MRLIIRVLLGLSLFVSAAALSSKPQSNSLDAQRELFLAAEEALQKGQKKQLAQLEKQLKSYPLYPYLEYQKIKLGLSYKDRKAVKVFLQRYQGTPLATQLRKRWLKYLAKHGRWKQYNKYYVADGNVTRQCHHLNALINTGKKHQAFKQAKDIWLSGKSRPDACDPVLKKWREAGLLTKQLVWQRIELAMGKGQTRLAKYLGRYLPAKDQPWLDKWLQIHRYPEKALERASFTKKHDYREAMLAHSVRRLAWRDTAQAIKHWHLLQKRYGFSKPLKHKVEKVLAGAIVKDSAPESWAYLSHLKTDNASLRFQEARLRAAIVNQDWIRLLNWVNKLPAAEKDTEQWRYWKARALAKTGKKKRARSIFHDLALGRSYYAFLAADHLNLEYRFQSADTPVPIKLKKKVALLPGLQRAGELVKLKRWLPARREWHALTKDMNNDYLMAVAKEAQSWSWHDQAIFTLARSGYWDDLTLRFPLEHQDNIQRCALNGKIDNAWVTAVIRQESAFMQDAHSPAGAMGLMQLMPATARSVSRKHFNRSLKNLTDLYQPERNIELGTAYLGQLFDKLDKHPVLATAAYNAGPHRVKKWLPDESLPADVWIEAVPFKETRGYLRRVLTYTAIYQQFLNGNYTRLKHHMTPIQGKVTQVGKVKIAG